MKINYRKIMIATVALGCTWGSLALSSDAVNADTVTAKTTLSVPALTKKAKLKKNARVYNKKGHRVGKKVLKKGKKITIYGTKKIRGKKYYAIGHGRYVLISKVKLLKAKPAPANNNSTNSGSSTSSIENSTPTNITKPELPKPGETKPADATKPEPAKPSENKPTGATKPEPAKPAKKPKKHTIDDFSISEFRAEFLKDLNAERAKRNLAPVTEDPHYDEVVQQRSALLPSNFEHVDAAGNFILENYFDNAGISYHSIAECIAMDPWGWVVNHNNNELEQSPTGGTSAEIADVAIYEYIYNDADSNWGHRDILLNANDKTIGVGAATEDDYIYSSVGVTY
ncbi:SLAP domain-containing protein [Lactobacillus sp. ESL0731]|uniref:SLAP domain-containing protein n=1 Tax=unclassified Lactobacillus TaxID=2620435 RepID=UPI0023F712BE|nr:MULTISPECIES: SLAP domain-containing protein [unclassified Lactobacillus]WEV50667.1 SLAP domain-containing protein [Lactobacillus sp. ESL0700]WEV61797.1 SLAP domain-containing protein [Lactobacillus sp. ESL0731]